MGTCAEAEVMQRLVVVVVVSVSELDEGGALSEERREWQAHRADTVAPG